MNDKLKKKKADKSARQKRYMEHQKMLCVTLHKKGDEDIIVITKLGVVIRTSLKQVAKTGRNTQGVKIIKISDKECVKSLTSLKSEEIEEEQPVVEEQPNE